MEIEKIELDKILKNRDNYNTSNHGKVDDYNEYIKKFDSKNWIDRFNKYEKIRIKKEDINLMWKILKLSNINGKFPKLYLEELDYLVDKYNNNLINNNFVRTDKTSLKNGCYGIKPYNNLREILESLLTTKFGHHGFNYNDDEINIYLLEWKEIDIDKEFRVFVVDNKISCISQQNIYKKSEYLINHNNINELIKDLDNYFRNNIRDKLLDYKNYIMDIAMYNNSFYFIEINPFGKNYSSGSACFHWINDNNIILDNSKINFRFVI